VGADTARAPTPQLSVIFLGVGAREPTAARGVAATLIVRGGEHILVDCGEGTHRQLLRSTAGLRGLTTILVTHLHADHVLGLPGLVATFSESRTAPLLLAGPAGTRRMIDGFRPHFGELRFELTIREAEPGDEIARDGYRLVALRAEHEGPALGWALVEDDRPGHLDPDAALRRGVPDGPDLGRLAAGHDVRVADRIVRAVEVTGPAQPGRRLVFSGDTRPADDVARAAQGADLLVHEATFLARDADIAESTRHSTVDEAAGLAAAAGVRALALTHRSQRYDAETVSAEAGRRFPGAMTPEDFDLIDVPLPEHGRPRLHAGAARRR
jgi:ribonuclease Z